MYTTPTILMCSMVSCRVFHIQFLCTLTREGIGGVHRVGVPMQVYAMYENGLRAKRQQSLQDNLSESARLYSRFSQVAAQNSMAWNRSEGPKLPESAQTIGTITKRNRMICFPCTLRSPSMKISRFRVPYLLTFLRPAVNERLQRRKSVRCMSGYVNRIC